MSSRSRKGRSSIRRKGSRRLLFKHLKDSTCKTGKRTYNTRLNALNALLVMQSLHKDDPLIRQRCEVHSRRRVQMSAL